MHLKSVKDGQFSNAFTYIYSYFLLKIFTRFDVFDAQKSFREHEREIQHESRRKAGGNLHLRSAVVDLRVQLVGETFTFFLLFMRRAYRSLCRSFSLSNSLFMMRWNSNREPLFILRNGSKLYPRCCLLYTLYTSDHSRAFQLTPTNALPFICTIPLRIGAVSSR